MKFTVDDNLLFITRRSWSPKDDSDELRQNWNVLLGSEIPYCLHTCDVNNVPLWKLYSAIPTDPLVPVSSLFITTRSLPETRSQHDKWAKYLTKSPQ